MAIQTRRDQISRALRRRMKKGVAGDAQCDAPIKTTVTITRVCLTSPIATTDGRNDQ